MKSTQPAEAPQMPNLNYRGKEACTPEEKVDLLKEKFFPKPPEADITDITGFTYPIELSSEQNI